MQGRSIFFICVFFACVVTGFASEKTAEEKKHLPAQSGFGMAILLGEPMAVNAKLWISDDSAIEAGAGWSSYRRTHDVRKRGAPYAYIELVRHFFDRVKAQKGKFVYCMGAGLEYAYNYYEDSYKDKQYYGVRFPFGISYMFDGPPIDIFLKIDPSIVFYYHGVTSDIGACVGVRYWFK